MVWNQNAGRSQFEHGNPAMGAIPARHPHRVLLTRLGRVEVCLMIGGPDAGGKSPDGPHTHVLPKLLKAVRTHSANAPVPDSWVPCCAIHPENPATGRLGEDRVFNAAAFDALQTLLGTQGVEAFCQGKQMVWDQPKAATPAEAAEESASREGRAGWRNASGNGGCCTVSAN